MPLVRHFRPLEDSPKWGVADGVGQWEPTMCLKVKVGYGRNFRPQLPRGGNLERSWGREGRFPCTHISTPKFRNCKIVDWLNEFLLWSFRSMGRTWLSSLWAEEIVLYWVWGVALDWFLSSGRGLYPLWYYFGVLVWITFV